MRILGAEKFISPMAKSHSVGNAHRQSSLYQGSRWTFPWRVRGSCSLATFPRAYSDTPRSTPHSVP